MATDMDRQESAKMAKLQTLLEERTAAKSEFIDQNSDLNLEKIIVYPTWREMLYDMIYDYGIDPWNIDIEKITSIYIEKIRKIQLLDLRIPANLILAAAILLRIKTYRMISYQQQTTIDEFVEHIPYNQINAIELRGRIPPKGRITIEDLVNAIEEVIKITKKREEQNQHVESLPQIQIKLSEFRVDKEMEKLYQKIKQNTDSYGLVTFSQLLEEKTKKQIIYTFIPLLFLAQNGKINLMQEEIFGEIFIRLVQ